MILLLGAFYKKKYQVNKRSLVNKRSRVDVFKVLFTNFIGTSQSPSSQGLLDGLNVQIKLTCLWTNFDITLGSIRIASSGSFYAPSKLVPLSDLICLIFPRRAIKWRKDKIKESLVRSPTISECMARVIMRVNITPYCLTSA